MIDVFFAKSQSSDFSILCSLYDKRESNFRHYQHKLIFESNFIFGSRFMKPESIKKIMINIKSIFGPECGSRDVKITRHLCIVRDINGPY